MTTTTMRLTAGARLPTILSALGRSGWGPLDGREWQGVRSVLRALGDTLHPRYGRGDTTAWQVSKGAGLSERWTRVCLGWLEDAGLIEWQRGGVLDGRPLAGTIRVVKSALIDVLRAARPAHDQASRDRAARTRLRLARAGIVTIRRQHRRRSDHAEPGASLPPSWRGREGHRPIPSTPTPITDKENTVTATTKGMPESVRLTRLRDQYLRNQGIVTPVDIADAHRYLGRVKDWDRQIAAARKQERRPEEDLANAPLW